VVPVNRRLPMVDRRGFPTDSHPESMDEALPEADEAALFALSAELWAAGEYRTLIAEHDRRTGGQQ
jgi:hypothetical protein